MSLADAMIHLIYPLSWEFPLSPLLPAHFLEIIEAPIPYIIGSLSPSIFNEDLSEELSQIVLVNLDSKELMVPEECDNIMLNQDKIDEYKEIFQNFIQPKLVIIK